MRRTLTTIGIVALVGASSLAAQVTLTPTYNAPYRAFSRSEFGVLLSFPSGGDVAIEGAYRMASGRLDLGFKGGVFLPGGGADAVFLAGVEGRQRVITHSTDFPLDGAVIVGVGGNFASGASVMIIPVGLSLGRRLNLERSTVSIVPYVQPTFFILAGDVVDNTAFALGLGADFRLSPRFDGRFSAGLGDVEGVSLGFVWLH
ncbi:MAG: hypothetical protein ACREN5_07065 [Gemmatimonadales bacterium]